LEQTEYNIGPGSHIEDIVNSVSDVWNYTHPHDQPVIGLNNVC